MAAEVRNGPLRVLVVEDEYLVALDLQAMLEELGCMVIGPAPTVAKAQRLLDQHRPDLALLDVNLGHERSTALAEELGKRGVPFALTTGYDEAQLPEQALREAPRLGKPVDFESLRRMLASGPASAGLRREGP